MTEHKQPTLSSTAIQKTLQSLHPSSRSSEELNQIYQFVSSSSEIIFDPLWNFLNKSQQLVLCRHMRLFHVFENEGETINLSNRRTDSKLFILLRGDVTVSYHDHNIMLGQSKQQQGACFGSLHLPKRVMELVIEKAKDDGIMWNTPYQCFLSDIDTVDGESSVRHHFHQSHRCNITKGSIYIAISSQDCKQHLEKLSLKVSSLDLLRQLNLNSVENCYRFRSIPAGTTMLKQEEESGHIFLIIQGTCLLLWRQSSISSKQTEEGTCAKEEKCDEKNCYSSGIAEDPGHAERQQHPNTKYHDVHIGSVGPMSFLGLMPHFASRDHTDRAQPLSVMSASPVKMLIFPAKSFLESIGHVSGMKNAFKLLARQQRQWLENLIPSLSNNNENDSPDMVKDVDAESNYANAEDSSSVSISSSQSIINMESLLQMRVKKKPKLNRTKFLAEWKRLITGGEPVYDWDEYEEPDDPFSRFEFIDIAMTSKCDGDDLSTLDPMGFLEFVPPVPPEGDDGEAAEISSSAAEAVDMLSPFPSILLDRKKHGKTLPAVKKSHGFIDPFSF